jgi:fermentation-respiration switch protein FrsA (DUF1100 family)
VGRSAGGVTALYGAYEQPWGEGASYSPSLSARVRAAVNFRGMLPETADSVMHIGGAPLVIFHGTEDATVPYVEAQQLVARAVREGIPYRLVTLTGQGHAARNNVPLFEAEMTPFLYQRLIPWCGLRWRTITTFKTRRGLLPIHARELLQGLVKPHNLVLWERSQQKETSCHSRGPILKGQVTGRSSLATGNDSWSIELHVTSGL